MKAIPTCGSRMIWKKRIFARVRAKGSSQTLFRRFPVSDRSDELLKPIRNGQYGDALYSFVQALLKIADVTFLTRERVKSTFLEDFREFIEKTVLKDRRTFDWHEPEHDPEGLYAVDCRIEVPRRTRSASTLCSPMTK